MAKQEKCPCFIAIKGVNRKKSSFASWDAWRNPLERDGWSVSAWRRGGKGQLNKRIESKHNFSGFDDFLTIFDDF
jgi:hypothetical protein